MTRAPKHWITVCDSATGVPLYSSEAKQGEEGLFCLEGQFWKAGQFDADIERVNPATRRRNKLQPMPGRVVGNTITGLPEGARVRVDGRLAEFDGTTLAVNAAYPQKVAVRIEHPLYLNRSFDMDLASATAEGGHAIEQNADLLRSEAYPASGEQLGALVKAVKALMAGEPVPDDALAVIAEVDAVKAALPKSPPKA